jgi:hypothetical protein
MAQNDPAVKAVIWGCSPVGSGAMCRLNYLDAAGNVLYTDLMRSPATNCGCVQNGPQCSTCETQANTQMSAWSAAQQPITPNTLPVTLAQAQAQAQAALLANMNCFILYHPDGTIRYDQNFVNSSLAFGILKGVSTPPLPALLTWQTAVKTYYLTQQAAINAAATVAAVQAVDVSLDGFEAKYGVSGSVAADPNITTAQFA